MVGTALGLGGSSPWSRGPELGHWVPRVLGLGGWLAFPAASCPPSPSAPRLQPAHAVLSPETQMAGPILDSPSGPPPGPEVPTHVGLTRWVASFLLTVPLSREPLWRGRAQAGPHLARGPSLNK